VIKEDKSGALAWANGKTLLLEKLLPTLHEDGHIVLIFSQMVSMVNIHEDYIVHKFHRYEHLDGSRPWLDRDLAIQQSSTDAGLFIMLMSTRAHDIAINVTTADRAITYDSNWNPQQDNHVEPRCRFSLSLLRSEVLPNLCPFLENSLRVRPSCATFAAASDGSCAGPVAGRCGPHVRPRCTVARILNMQWGSANLLKRALLRVDLNTG
jgi:hypothetical protein